MAGLFHVFLTFDPVLPTLFVIAVVLLYSYLNNIYSVFNKLNIPGPKPKWIFGNLGDFKDKFPLEVFKELRLKFGDVFGFFEGFRPSIVISDPEIAKQVLVKHFDKFHVRPIYNPFVYYPDNLSLLNTYGDTWRRQRSVVASAFKSVNTAHVVKCLNRVADKLVSKLEESAAHCQNGFDISSLIDRFSVDAFAYAAFNYNVNSLDDENATLYRYMKAFNHSSAADNPAAGLARVYESLTPFLKIFDKEHAMLHELHVKEIRKCIQQERIRQLSEQDMDTAEKNLLHHIMQGSVQVLAEDGKWYRRGLTDEDIVAHINSLIGGGLGTLNASIEFVIHMLSVHPSLQQKLYENIIEVCGNEENPTDQQLKNLEEMDKFIFETLRLLPCAPGVARTCTEDCEINGIPFKKGWFVRIMLCTLYTDDSVFPNAEVFDPERFSTTEKEKRHPYAFLPSGQGPRMCPGYNIALYQTKASLVKILRKFVIESCPKTVDPLPTALRPMLCPRNGVFIKLRNRSKTQ
ncbi:cytochrome P450 3A28-like isoform X1 [Saccostrea echinata]|uniref:cytochrome P450 3A28-like isoform X1 n=1 Tax=Saccostrea echinata TaxID=191078 RepID=UPI002A8270FB|nr:cytochrome P450 3A28-like isoform X1 [Saccostrea echinata]XP_061185432.1 cytochrome P450 3A28-like isoform X1 [Saccostrea echinata]XP_061185433.1 cytochrome P450 3A28-like isoform X1 [Saccostrea echinata]